MFLHKKITIGAGLAIAFSALILAPQAMEAKFSPYVGTNMRGDLRRRRSVVPDFRTSRQAKALRFRATVYGRKSESLSVEGVR